MFNRLASAMPLITLQCSHDSSTTANDGGTDRLFILLLSVVHGTFDMVVFSTPFSNGRYSYNRGCLSLPPVTTCTRDDLYCSQPGV